MSDVIVVSSIVTTNVDQASDLLDTNNGVVFYCFMGRSNPTWHSWRK